MDDRKLFSQFYSADTTRNEDKPKFRNRVLKYLEDHVRSGFPNLVNKLCRSKMGIDIKSIKGDRYRDHVIWCVEDTFKGSGVSISEILDFISVVYDAEEEHIPGSSLPVSRLKDFVDAINRIFQEESMCYVLHDNGRVRYYPDEEFHRAVKATLVVLNKPQYQDNLKLFNDVLDDLYKNHGKELPVHEFFKCVEILALSLINDNKFKILNDSSVDALMNKITDLINADSLYVAHDKEAVLSIRGIFSKWVSMCHKYRHGKADQVNNDVPAELFNFIFTVGISIFRFLLQINDKYTMKS